MSWSDHHIPADLDAPSAGRRLVESWMGDDPRAPDAVLAVSELIANAVVHGGTDTEALGLVIRLETDGTTWRVEVSQPSDGGLVQQAGGPARGLGLVEAAVDRWGVDDGDDDRLVVWFEVDGVAVPGRR